MIYDETYNASMHQRFGIRYEIIFTESNISLLNLISRFKIYL